MNNLAVFASTAALAFVGAAAEFPLDVVTFWFVAVPLGIIANAFVATEGIEPITPRRWFRIISGSIAGVCLGAGLYFWWLDVVDWGALVAAVFCGACPEWVLKQIRRYINRRTDSNDTEAN